MIKQIMLTGLLLGINYTCAEEVSTLDRLKTLSKEGVTKFQESSRLATETKSASFMSRDASTGIDIFCNTQAYAQGHRIVTGVGCQIEYKFFARNIYSYTELTGNILPSSSEDECDNAIAICKKAQFSFKEADNNHVDIVHQNKIIGTVDFSKEIIGFTSR
jgi:hypothetical protein